MQRTLFTAVAFVCFAVADGHAAILTLRGECRPSGAVVTLADLADIDDNNPAMVTRLNAVEIMPAPASIAKRLTVRQLQDQLELRGIDLNTLRFSGATNVNILPPAAAPKTARVTGVMQRAAEKALQDAIRQHLQEVSERDEPWDIDVQANDDAVRLVSAAVGPLRIAGGAAPWTGTQSYQVIANANGNVGQAQVTAKITLPPIVISAARNIPKGTLLRATDLRIERVPGRARNADALQSIEEVVGREAARAIAEGQTVDRALIRSPVLVKKGDVVTVYARNGGVQVRITARAREDGGHNDVITVESLLDRKVINGRVTGPQEVEVFAKGITAQEPAAVQPATYLQPLTR